MIVEFSDQQNSVKIQKTFHPPKRKTADVEAWFKEARKCIPEIPDVEGSEWISLHQPEISPAFVKWTIVRRDDFERRCHLVIARKAI